MDTKHAEILTKLEAIKNIAANKKKVVKDKYDSIQQDISASENVLRKRIDDYHDSLKAKKTNQKDIFDEIIKLVEPVLGEDSTDTSNLKGKYKIKKYAQICAKNTLHASKQIIMDAVKSALFSGDGVCGTNSTMVADTITISPKEFDFLNMLLISPLSTTGSVMYESDQDTGFIKLNTEFYNCFDSGTPYVFNSKNGNELFTIVWDDSTQLYTVSGLQGALGLTSTQEFITDYYASIEYPDFDNIVSQAILLAIQGDGTEPKSFTASMDNLERLLQKLFSVCGKQSTDSPLNQVATNQVNENDEDIEWYFNFDDVEGIDMEQEDARARRVLKFKDCDNFETPISSNNIEDFVYFMKKGKNTDDNVSDAIDKLAKDAYEDASQTITLEDLKLSLTGLYISKLPKALISAVFSPKVFFPIVVVYKLIKSISIPGFVIYVKDLMKKMSDLFYKIVKKLFWKFIQEFWKLVKKDILNFLKQTAQTILKNKLKRWKKTISALINILLKLLETKIESCDVIFNTILTTINTALTPKISIPIPGALLTIADQLPGFSADRAYMNAVENLSIAGVPMGPLFGRDNDLNSVIKGILDGHTDEMAENAYVKIALKANTLLGTGPTGPVQVNIVPGLVQGAGIIPVS